MTAWRRLGNPYWVRPGGRGRSDGSEFFFRAIDGLLEQLIEMQMHGRRRGRQVVREVGFREES